MRGALVELKALHRIPGPWLPLALGVWILVAWLQEPTFLRRSEVPFFWDSVHSALVAALAGAPLGWLLGRDASAAEVILRAARTPLRVVSISTLSIIIYGSEIALFAGLLGFGLDLVRGVPSPREALETVFTGLCLLAPLAALAPGLANLRLTAHGYTVFWLLLAVSYAFLFGPGSAAGAVSAGWMATMVPAVLATVAGLLLSAALANRRIHI